MSKMTGERKLAPYQAKEQNTYHF